MNQMGTFILADEQICPSRFHPSQLHHIRTYFITVSHYSCNCHRQFFDSG